MEPVEMKTISDFDFRKKTVVVRSDLDSGVVNGKVVEGERIKAASLTIKELKKKKARVIILAHQGRPGKRDFISLREHARLLSKYTKVKFAGDLLGKKARESIHKLKFGEALLLENVRFEADEFKPELKKKNKILKFLLLLTDIYVNDAFANSHRDHTSMVGFAEYKPSCIGREAEKEINALKKMNLEKTLIILGGAKPEDNLRILKKGRTILAGGIFGQLCLISKGYYFGKKNEKENKNFVKNYSHVLKQIKLKLKNVKVVLPVDYAIGCGGKRKELMLNEFPTKYVIYDIGKKTQGLFASEIKKYKFVYMKGPLGYASKRGFEKGTVAVLKAIAKSKSYSLLGGGQLSDAIKKSKIPKSKFSHISLSGGALLKFLAGEKLPGLKVLGYYK